MSKLTIIGDVHGKTGEYRHLLNNIKGPSIQIGDMGLGFKGVGLPPPGTTPQAARHRFFRGNHDSPEKCRQHPNYMGDWGFDSDWNLFWLAGAWSIDQQWRTEGVSWWRDEELNILELNQAQNLYIEKNPRFMLSHEAPTVAAMHMLSGLLIPSSHNDNATTVAHDDKYRYYKSKLGCANTRTSQALQQMFAIHQPEEWVFGHYHVSTSFTVPGFKTKFTCVGELDTYELDV